MSVSFLDWLLRRSLWEKNRLDSSLYIWNHYYYHPIDSTNGVVEKNQFWIGSSIVASKSGIQQSTILHCSRSNDTCRVGKTKHPLMSMVFLQLLLCGVSMMQCYHSSKIENTSHVRFGQSREINRNLQRHHDDYVIWCDWIHFSWTLLLWANFVEYLICFSVITFSLFSFDGMRKDLCSFWKKNAVFFFLMNL